MSHNNIITQFLCSAYDLLIYSLVFDNELLVLISIENTAIDFVHVQFALIRLKCYIMWQNNCCYQFQSFRV